MLIIKKKGSRGYKIVRNHNGQLSRGVGFGKSTIRQQKMERLKTYPSFIWGTFCE